MIKIKGKVKQATEVPMSATSDIAFLLIIFFMLAFMLSDDAGVKLNQPKEDQEPKEVPQSLISNLFIDADNSITIDDYPVVLNDLEDYLAAKYISNPDIFVLIQVHEQAKYGFMVQVFTVLRKISDLHYSIKLYEERAG